MRATTLDVREPLGGKFLDGGVQPVHEKPYANYNLSAVSGSVSRISG
jgi:hypothetical protein